MNNTNWDEFKCRCSAISKMMSGSRSNPQITEKQNLRLIELEAKESLTEKQMIEMAELGLRKQNKDKVVLSATCVSYLLEVYSWEKYGMKSVGKEVMEVDAMKKGTLAEEDSITLLSLVDNTLYLKNQDKITNEFLSGRPDLFVGDDVLSASKIIDIKTSLDYPLFLQKLHDDLPIAYIMQVQGYCDITGATEGEIAHCLSNVPEVMINSFKRKLFYSMDVVTEESPEFLAEWEILEHSMRFDQIPPRKRVFKQKVEPFTEFERQAVYDRVKHCREWLWKFQEKYDGIEKLVPLMQNDSL